MLFRSSLSGDQLRGLLEQQQRPGHAEPRFLQPSAGLHYQWHASAPFGHRVQQLQLGGVAVQPQGRYRVTVNSFLADGGDGYTLLRGGRDRLTGPQDVDALVQWLQQADTPLAPEPMPRIAWVD